MKLITKNGFCPACMMTKKILDQKGIKYTVTHIKTPEQRKHILDMHFRSYPIVEPDNVADSKTFCGFHPEIINKWDTATVNA